MPIPKEKQKEWGRVYGHWINKGKSKEVAKKYADAAVGIREHLDKKKG